MEYFYCQQNNGEKMGSSPILFIIYTGTIRIILNFNDLNDGNDRHGLKTLHVNKPLNESLQI